MVTVLLPDRAPEPRGDRAWPGSCLGKPTRVPSRGPAAQWGRQQDLSRESRAGFVCLVVCVSEPGEEPVRF